MGLDGMLRRGRLIVRASERASGRRGEEGGRPSTRPVSLRRLPPPPGANWDSSSRKEKSPFEEKLLGRSRSQEEDADGELVGWLVGWLGLCKQLSDSFDSWAVEVGAEWDWVRGAAERSSVLRAGRTGFSDTHERLV